MPRRTLKVEKGLIHVSKFIEGAPVVDLDKVPPNTYYRIRNDGQYVFVTIMPDGLYVGWDNCERCHNIVSGCKCDKGIEAPKSVQYIYSKRVDRIAQGLSVEVTIVDKETVKPTSLPIQGRRKGQVSAPSDNTEGKLAVTQTPKRKRLKRIKPS